MLKSSSFRLLACNLVAAHAHESDKAVAALDDGSRMNFYPGGGGTGEEREMGNSPCKAWCAKQDPNKLRLRYATIRNTYSRV
jgi:hypothetical protein